MHAITRNTLDGKGDVGPRPQDMYLVRAVHQRFQLLHGLSHLIIIHQAGCKIKILIFLSAHAGQLGHGIIGIAQHGPLGVVAAFRQMDGPPVMLAVVSVFLI